ncbi:lactococcin 972 family bacteriocin [Arthrobacter bambusae]|uniref:lactococcin 972 family bacteriocin n=1 Tax=Arthrobacter bambusae TaxID=1338426 RepID=UPI00277D94F9|nr:lactococcin 972 family bacteriocin [Arthrobacter bambusae]MDQ0029864.1 lactococcin 972 family bacteriocin [Arthrobacter bambusae]MDQ0097618.1 lactococcin 972 family bacteriocin [Arthrobacter bambusae]
MDLKKTVAGIALTGALCSVAGTAVAGTQYPAEGGTWNYGYNIGIYSDYMHGSRCHGSSVRNDWGYNSSINTAGGYWANAWHSGNIWTHNSWYHRVC